LISGTASNTAICKIKKNTKTNGVVSTNGNITNIENNITFFYLLSVMVNNFININKNQRTQKNTWRYCIGNPGPDLGQAYIVAELNH
jgi:hypothetical protein